MIVGFILVIYLMLSAPKKGTVTSNLDVQKSDWDLGGFNVRRRPHEFCRPRMMTDLDQKRHPLSKKEGMPVKGLLLTTLWIDYNGAGVRTCQQVGECGALGIG